MIRLHVRIAFSALAVFASIHLPSIASAQGTQLWTTSRYDDMERGTAQGVAIGSDGRLEPGPATSRLYETNGNYVWAIATDTSGNAYVGVSGTTAGSAVVMKVAPDGKAARVFEGKELGVQALRLGTDGHIYAATSPDGKVYRLGTTPADATVVFDPAITEDKPRYLWDIVQAPGPSGDLFVATGAPAAVYRVPAGGGKPQVAFKTADQHIRCLQFAPDGNLWAGSDGSGVIYRFNTRIPGAKPFAAYDATKVEITSLALDSAGNIYASGVGTRPAAGAPRPGLPPLPVTGAVGVSITFSQPGSANAATQNTLIPEGSEIYRIAPDGSPETLLALKDDVVYALRWHKGNLLAATGNRGRVYRIDTQKPGDFADVAHLEAAQGMAFADTASALLVATSNSGRVYKLEDTPSASATYTSEVFDAHVFSRWVRVEMQPEPPPNAELFVRTGNIESPLNGWSDWSPVARDGAATLSGGRYAQWKAVLHAGASVESVSLNYLQKNLAPIVDQLVVQQAARVAPGTAASNTSVQITFPSSSPAAAVFQPDANAQPLLAQKDLNAITARWSAHDDNSDDLVYSVWYRGTGEQNWRLLKSRVTDKYFSFDGSQLPDGTYQLKVVASDAPDHPGSDTLTGDRSSEDFVIDSTPPVPGTITANLVSGPPGQIHAVFQATDATSPIAHAEYSVDAGPWQYVEPVDHVSDSKTERYDFTAPIPIPRSDAESGIVKSGEHVIAIRVYDRYENMAAAKTVVR